MKNSTIVWIIIILSILGYYNYKFYLYNPEAFYLINTFIWILWEMIFGLIRWNFNKYDDYSFKKHGWRIVSITPLFFTYIIIKYYINEILDKV